MIAVRGVEQLQKNIVLKGIVYLAIIVLSVLLMYIISIRQEAESLVKKQINDMNNGTKITQEKMKNNVYIVKITPKKPLVELQQEKLFGLEYSLDQTIVLNVDDQI